MKKCCVLFSGGIDSTTTLYWARKNYDNVCALTFNYGQRHAVEIEMAKKTAAALNIPQTILFVDLQQIRGSSLTDPEQNLPEFSSHKDIKAGVPSTYVPFRNGIFLSMAAAWGEVQNIQDLICGFNVIDSPNYPDTTRDFAQAMETAINLGTAAAYGGKAAVRVLAPFVGLKKSDIIREGLSLGADYSFSISCYAGKEIPCLRCSSCLLRQKAWEETGKQDPLINRLKKEGKL
ncbi:MAG: 7-cyano-7-deazaguanine synthase QueC [Candidatus Aminicenantes bacterium]|nr:7-cyano-7-deazaguanine synthase QueC [Candidatus Aminicenantes bacterium]